MVRHNSKKSGNSQHLVPATILVKESDSAPYKIGFREFRQDNLPQNASEPHTRGLFGADFQNGMTMRKVPKLLLLLL